MKRVISALLLVIGVACNSAAFAADYVIDTKGAHASIIFKIQHLGYSWLYGQFNEFSGEFSYDANKPEESKISVTVKTASVDSNHAERDKHLKGKEFLSITRFPEAKFVSTAFKPLTDTTAELMGDLTLKGVTKPITIAVTKIGEGKDPWGGYRVGFSGETKLVLADFGIKKNLGPAARTVDMILNIEGIRQ